MSRKTITMVLKIHQSFIHSLESTVLAFWGWMEVEPKCLDKAWHLQVDLMPKIHSWVLQELKDSVNLVIPHKWPFKNLVMKVQQIRFTFSNSIKEFSLFTTLRLIKRPVNSWTLISISQLDSVQFKQKMVEFSLLVEQETVLNQVIMHMSIKKEVYTNYQIWFIQERAIV